MTELLYKWVLPQRIWSFWKGSPRKDDPDPYYFSFVGFSSDRGLEGACGCNGWRYGKVKFCKHNKGSYLGLTNDERKEFLMKNDMYVSSSIPKINEMQIGWPVGTIQALTGRSRSGKTLIMLQDAMFTQKDTGKNIVLVLSEAWDSKFQIAPWVKRYNKRFKTDYQTEIWLLDEPTYLTSCFVRNSDGRIKKKDGKPVFKFHYDIPWVKELPEKEGQKVIAIQLPSLFSLFLLVGTPAMVRNTEGGQQQIKPRPEWEMLLFLTTPLGEILSESNVGFMALDSLSAPLKNIFIGGEQTFNARSNAEAMILSRFDYLCKVFKVPCLILHHISENPARASKAKAYGGAMVLYTHKFELEVMGGKKPYMRNRRIPDVKPEAWTIEYRIGDKGIYGV